MEDKIMTKCNCGSTDFLILSESVVNADLDVEGKLVAHGHEDGGITKIVCGSCGREHSEDDFEEICL